MEIHIPKYIKVKRFTMKLWDEYGFAPGWFLASFLTWIFYWLPSSLKCGDPIIITVIAPMMALITGIFIYAIGAVCYYTWLFLINIWRMWEES